jgi:translation initiation factor IF-2
MNISTLAKILGISSTDLRDIGVQKKIRGFQGRNTRIPYASAVEITKVVRPDKAENLKDDDNIYLSNTLTVAELAESIDRPVGIVMRYLLTNGVMATINEKIDFDTAAIIASELNIEVRKIDENQDLSIGEAEPMDFKKMSSSNGAMVKRPAIVTIMGHVDHGKTTLLDRIRHTNVVDTEAGAITQHITSYQIEYKGEKITFMDTPGHEAFAAMRARGSQLADIVIIVVSAVEGVKPQTTEVIQRVKLAKTQAIVAVNKIDLPDADPMRIMQDVAAFGLVPEEWGGNVPFVQISAKQGLNVDKLLDTIILMSEVMELKGEIDCPAQAVVVESHVESKLGIVSHVIVTKDTLRVGDYVAVADTHFKIKQIQKSSGEVTKTASICEPVAILGSNQLIGTGEVMVVFPDKKSAEKVAIEEERRRSIKKIKLNRNTSTLVDKKGSTSNLHLVLKADVNGSLEALKEAILKIPTEGVNLIIKDASVGQISENDLQFAQTSDSTIIAFHTSANQQALRWLKDKKEDINLIQSDVIYELLSWVEEAILSRVKREIKITVLGKAEILATFRSDKPTIQVFGGEVLDGKILSNKNLQVWRNGEMLGVLEVLELQKNKQKVADAFQSQQFGISTNAKVKVQKGDIIESIDETVVK